ncbi:MAG: GGDEF domain-containing protein [bacterium]|nr:GGDEF domain-containing protein [bacterium]
MSNERREQASREELLQEIARLEQMVKAYEKVNSYSERELVKANRMLAAYEEAQDLTPAEIHQLQQQMQQGLRRPVPPETAVDSLQNQIRAAITAGLSGDGEASADSRVLERLEDLRSSAGPEFYVEFFRLMVHLDFSEREARVYWDDIVDHTHFLSRAFGRAIPFRVAMLDYFLQRSPMLRNPRLIEMHTFDDVVRTSLQDQLTGLYNRRYLDRCLLQEFRRAERHGHPVTIVIFDIDDFKTYNDSFGHPAGDEAMRTIGGLMAASFREEDQACRYGGEEFVVVLPETDAAAAGRVAERFVQAVRDTGFSHRPITMSGGLADYPRLGLDPGRVFLAADQALYRAKAEGKNRLVTARETEAAGSRSGS